MMAGPACTEIPPWLAGMPGDACLGSPEMVRLFGGCMATVHKWVNRGVLPPPDWRTPGFRGFHNKAGAFKWRVRTIRNFIRQQAAVKKSTGPEISGSQPGA